MGAVEDYINGLEGKTDLNPQTIARDLLALHNQEIGSVNDLLSSAQAKIADQENAITTSAQALAEAQAETSRVKLQNYDLVMSTGVNTEGEPERVVDDTNITPDDLFVAN